MSSHGSERAHTRRQEQRRVGIRAARGSWLRLRSTLAHTP